VSVLDLARGPCANRPGPELAACPLTVPACGCNPEKACLAGPAAKELGLRSGPLWLFV
jgi:hypothetical protein